MTRQAGDRTSDRPRLRRALPSSRVAPQGPCIACVATPDAFPPPACRAPTMCAQFRATFRRQPAQFGPLSAVPAFPLRARAPSPASRRARSAALPDRRARVVARAMIVDVTRQRRVRPARPAVRADPPAAQVRREVVPTRAVPHRSCRARGRAARSRGHAPALRSRRPATPTASAARVRVPAAPSPNAARRRQASRWCPHARRLLPTRALAHSPDVLPSRRACATPHPHRACPVSSRSFRPAMRVAAHARVPVRRSTDRTPIHATETARARRRRDFASRRALSAA